MALVFASLSGKDDMKNRTADHNLGYFDQFPAPMYEEMCKILPCENINATTPFYGPLLYAMARIIGAHNAVEIGIAEGYCSGFLAHAIQDNNKRYAMGGRFFGIDIGDKSWIQAKHDEQQLPSTFIQDEKGSVHWLETQKILGPETVDLVFIDGLHFGPYIAREIELIYPLVKGNGNGYICCHDVYSTAEEIWLKLLERTAPDINGVMKPAWEHMRFLNNYGFGILRKMEGYDHQKKHWPDGDQKDLAISQGVCDAEGKLLC